jgi:hypothetical protein
MKQSEHGKALCILMQHEHERNYSFTELEDMLLALGEYIRDATVILLQNTATGEGRIVVISFLLAAYSGNSNGTQWEYWPSTLCT